MNTKAVLVGAILMGCLALCATNPPQLINYQGVLRDSSDRPLTGTYDMTFRFYDGFGNLLLTDAHTGTGVDASDGLFKAALGGGTITGGLETSLVGVFANHGVVWLEIQVGTETLSPRVRVHSAAYAQNASTLDGHDSAEFAITTNPNTWSAAQVFQTNTFFPYSSVWDGYGNVGIHTSPGADLDVLDAHAWLRLTSNANAAWGSLLELKNITPSATTLGQINFNDASDSVPGQIAYDTANDLTFRVNSAERMRVDANGRLGIGTATPQTSIDVLGAQGAIRLTSNNDAAYGSVLELKNATSSPTTLGAINFNDAAATYPGQIAYDASNNMTFRTAGSESMRIAADGNVGMGTVPGADARLSLVSPGGSGNVYAAMDDTGIQVQGESFGGFFSVPDDSCHATVASKTKYFPGVGIDAVGNYAGGFFTDLGTSGTVGVSTGSSKIYGGGSVSFVQDHPAQKDKVIVYACPEGDEVATYTRGTAKLAGGEAHVKLGETFQWVTNPDIGLTAHLTPVGGWSDLYVAQKSTTELVVRSNGGAQDAVFDYVVYGLRIGFEESSVVQPKRREYYIPAFTYHRKIYAEYPELRPYNALERFKLMESQTRGVAPESLDLSRAKALKDAIHEYDPATDPPVEKLFGYGGGRPASAGASSKDTTPGPTVAANPQGQPLLASTHATATAPASKAAESVAAVVSPALPCLPSAESVEEGVVLVMDPARERHVAPCREQADPLVVGVAAKAGGPCVEGEAQADATLRVPLITSGIALCKADAAYGPIRRGDLLVTSPTPGHAMRSANPAPGTVLGKALEPLPVGTGLIEVLVMMR